MCRCGCGYGVCVRGVACVVWHAENVRVWIQKRLRVYVQNVPVCIGTTRTCLTTFARVASKHGDVLKVHTEAFLKLHTGVIASSAYQEKPTRASEVHQRNPWMFPILSLRIDREQHVPDSSNHSLYLIKLLNSSSPEESAAGWFDLSCATKTQV